MKIHSDNSLLSYKQLVELVEQGVIDAPLENINAASIDITLGSEIKVELKTTPMFSCIHICAKESINTDIIDITHDYILEPFEFILASSQEIFNLPNNICAEYKLKSSLARNGLQHMLAGWCDPGWSNSKLTLELKNVTKYHSLVLKAGMKIGQMVFWQCDPVPHDKLYSVTGQYNNQKSVTESKGLR